MRWAGVIKLVAPCDCNDASAAQEVVGLQRSWWVSRKVTMVEDAATKQLLYGKRAG